MDQSTPTKGEMLSQREEFLAERLRDVCVEDEDSRKMKERNPKQSAKIIQQLGRVYRERSPNKILIIKSAALFNAAIVRKPDNLDEVRAHLSELCSHVLHLADAEIKNADFVEKAASIFKQVEEMRSMAKTELDKIGLFFTDFGISERSRKADQIKELQDTLTQVYIKIMREIMEYCIKVKGPPPCQYALIGMGSLARKEITPYSDFESAVLLENGIETKENYEETLEYFRWVAVFFQLVMVNFGETIIRFVAISSLNNPCNKDEDWFYDAFTPCGICPDGLAPQASKNPLGRQDSTEKKPWITELIKPVSEMLKYLDQEEDVKNGYHLADILTKTCFISGEQRLHEHFIALVSRKLAGEKLTAKFIEQMNSDQLNFNGAISWFTLLFANNFDLKRIIYRSITLFLAALSRLYGLQWSSSFDIIDQMRKKERISVSESVLLKYVLSTALEARMRVYTKNDSQADHVESAAHFSDDKHLLLIRKVLGGMNVEEFVGLMLALQGLVLSALEEAKEKQAETTFAELKKNKTSTSNATSVGNDDDSRRPQTGESDTATETLRMTSEMTRLECDAIDEIAELKRNMEHFFSQPMGDRKLTRLEIEEMQPFFEMLAEKHSTLEEKQVGSERRLSGSSKYHEVDLAAQNLTSQPDQHVINTNVTASRQSLRVSVHDQQQLRQFTAGVKILSQAFEAVPNSSGSRIGPLLKTSSRFTSTKSVEDLNRTEEKEDGRDGEAPHSSDHTENKNSSEKLNDKEKAEALTLGRLSDNADEMIECDLD